MTTSARTVREERIRDRPNVLLLCTDQQRFDTLGAYRNPEVNTPNLDRLANEGALFENCYAQSSVCAPSRASLMSGMYVHSHGLHANGVELSPNVRLLPEAMTDAGYDCGLVGKWHLDACFGGRTEQQPAGFRVWQWAHDPYPGSSENAYHRWLANTHPIVYRAVQERDRTRRGQTAGVSGTPIDEVPTEAHYSHWVGDETIRYLTQGRREDQPFFFVSNFFDPHHSFGAPREYRERYDADRLSLPVTMTGELDDKPAILTEASRESYAGHAPGYQDYTADELQDIKANYYAMVTLIDDEVGRILDTLDEQGLTDSTVVIFTSDHGELLGDHQLMLKGPMMYDCSVRVPLLVRWPAHISSDLRIDNLVQLIDVTATIAELGDADLPSAQGMPLLALAAGRTTEHRGWALSEYRDSGHPYDSPVHTTMVRHGDIKVVIHHGSPSSERKQDGELYDLRADPHELTNLWNDPEHDELRGSIVGFALDALVATEDRSQPRKAFW